MFVTVYMYNFSYFFFHNFSFCMAHQMNKWNNLSEIEGGVKVHISWKSSSRPTQILMCGSAGGRAKIFGTKMVMPSDVLYNEGFLSWHLFYCFLSS